MDCGKIHELLQNSRLFAASEDSDNLRTCQSHLEECQPCRELLAAEQKFDSAVHKVIHATPVPQALESSILWSLRQHQRERQRSRVLYWSMAAAAALLLAVGLNWYYQRPYDLSRLHETIALNKAPRALATYDLAQGRQPASLQQWLKRHGIAVTLPARLKLQHLSAAWIIEAGGRKIPVLELRAGSATSRICLLQRRYFNEHLQQQLATDGILSSFVIADQNESPSLGWMIVERGSAHLFVDDALNPNGI